ncbi:MAG TPA: hypothetical protein VGR16_13570 [Thermomicrobiales bacterium]|nr:hypothetical protein [Thermomicrobiales bacterium]
MSSSSRLLSWFRWSEISLIGQLNSDSCRAGRSVDHRALDLFIAATAIEHGLSLVARNTRDYADIPGLVLYGG